MIGSAQRLNGPVGPSGDGPCVRCTPQLIQFAVEFRCRDSRRGGKNLPLRRPGLALEASRRSGTHRLSPIGRCSRPGVRILFVPRPK